MPLGLRGTVGTRQFYRDAYYDTADRVLERRQISCRLRVDASGVYWLTVKVRDGEWTGHDATSQITEAAVPSDDMAAVIADASAPARLLQAIVDPQTLVPMLELETARRLRPVRWRWFRRPAYVLVYDVVTARAGTLSTTFGEVKIQVAPGWGPSAARLAAALANHPAATLSIADKPTLARELLATAEREGLSDGVRGGPEVAVLPFHAGLLGLMRHEDGLGVLTAPGTGEAGCRKALAQHFSSDVGQVRLLGVAPAAGVRPMVEVWLARRLAAAARDAGVLEWVPLDRIAGLAQAGRLRDPLALAALHVAARSDLMLERPTWVVPAPGGHGDPDSLEPADPVAPVNYLNTELSLLGFHERVLAMAEDSTLPVRDRVRFLGIVGANLDEFTMVQVAALKRDLARGGSRPTPDGLTPAARLDAVGMGVRALHQRAYRCLTDILLPALAAEGTRVLRWPDLDGAGRTWLSHYFQNEVYPLLTPLAVTPGHPFPHIANVTVALAVAIRHERTGVEHFATVNVPPSLPRFVELPDTGDVIPIEAMMCANIHEIFAGVRVVRAHTFRVTRSGEASLDNEAGEDLLQAVAVQVARRGQLPVVRLEVEHSMPVEMRELLLQEFRFEAAGRVSRLARADVYDFARVPALRALMALAGPPEPDPRAGRSPFDPVQPILAQIAARDVLVHFPYDAFGASVGRLLTEAADDPAVVAVKLTLYRMDDRSTLQAALHNACRAGKSVTVFIEVKARFDEARNIAWVQDLRAGGVEVVYGLPGLKTHAKIALIVRREGLRLRRYAYVGTGNFHAATAAAYTDFGLFTCHEDLTQDVADLFNDLTGYATRDAYRRILVSPTQMLDHLVRMIDREAQHAREGRGGRIRAKMNGLDEPEVIAALYRASQAGVETDLIVRGICALRPGVPGVSERIRVKSILGMFLEHGRAFHFANGGEDEYYIGSADWRQRNLRRRVEVAVPILDSACRARLGEILDTELADPAAWELGPDGAYRQRRGGQGVTVGAQERFLAGVPGLEGR